MSTTNMDGILSDLLEICRDGQNGFDTAARAIDDSALKAELMQYSMQRQEFASEIRSLMAALGETANDGGSVSAALHRGRINIKAKVAGGDRHAVLAECERGEDAAVAAYREAIDEGLASIAAPVIQSQYEQILRVHDRVRALRDAAKVQAA